MKTREEIYNDYVVGKTSKRIQYGIKYPDGTILWDSSNAFMTDIDTLEGQEKMIAYFEDQCEKIHVPIGKLTFLKRTETTKYTQPIDVTI